VSTPNPAADTYTVVVDGFAVPAGTTAYDYRDVFYSPALGGAVVGRGNVLIGTVTGG
jgi:hypothetical protein